MRTVSSPTHFTCAHGQEPRAVELEVAVESPVRRLRLPCSHSPPSHVGNGEGRMNLRKGHLVRVSVRLRSIVRFCVRAQCEGESMYPAINSSAGNDVVIVEMVSRKLGKLKR